MTTKRKFRNHKDFISFNIISNNKVLCTDMYRAEVPKGSPGLLWEAERAHILLLQYEKYETWTVRQSSLNYMNSQTETSET